MLGNSAQPLVKHKLEYVVVHMVEECVALDIRAPMAYRQADQFMFVGGKLQMVSHEQPAKEGDSTDALMENRSKTRVQGIAIHHELLVEVRKVEDGCGGERELEGIECCRRLGRLGECLFLEKLCEWHRDGTVVLYESPIVPR